LTQRLPQEATTAVPAEQVQSLALETLVEHFPLRVEGYRYEGADIFNVVIAAASQERSIDSVYGAGGRPRLAPLASMPMPLPFALSAPLRL